MKTQILNKYRIEWSKWYREATSNSMVSHLHNWNGFQHPECHAAMVYRYVEGGKIFYKVSVNCGRYGKVSYVFADNIASAKEARLMVETGVDKALHNGNLYF